MPRRAVLIAVAVIAVAVAGFLFAVVVPRDSDELPPPAVIVDKTITLKPLLPETSPHAIDEVWRAFGRAGLR